MDEGTIPEMVAMLATVLVLDLAPLHLVPAPRSKSHVGLDTPEGEVCPSACELQLHPGEVQLLYQSYERAQPVKFSLDLPPRGATIEFSDPPFREFAGELLGPACMLEGALFYGIGAAAQESGWKGFGLVSIGIGAVALVVGLLTRPDWPPVEARDADGKRLELRF